MLITHNTHFIQYVSVKLGLSEYLYNPVWILQKRITY
jgi:hypothetical protein